MVLGKTAFELYDTYGFPIDLTALIAAEKGWTVDQEEFKNQLEIQKQRSRKAADSETGDWNVVHETEENRFVGYDQTEAEVKITRWRQVSTKGKDLYHLVMDQTPFYAESGGQVGDTGFLQLGEEKVSIVNTKKENDLIVHFAAKLPADPSGDFKAVVSTSKRATTAKNHSATHLLHEALREVLGTHVEQKGSLVHPDYLRFDFSHFSKVNTQELKQVEQLVNQRAQANLPLEEFRSVPMSQAQEMGAMALFGEKYGEEVRVIKFGDSVELCGGIHVGATGEIGVFKITSEGAIAAGVRRVECLTGPKAFAHLNDKTNSLLEVAQLVKNPKDVVAGVNSLIEENEQLRKQVEKFEAQQTSQLQSNLKSKISEVNGVQFLGANLGSQKPDSIKNLAFGLKKEVENLFMIVGSENNNKAMLTIMIDDNLVASRDLNAVDLIRELSREIQGGGGGQPFYATAGGKNIAGLDKAIERAREVVEASAN